MCFRWKSYITVKFLKNPNWMQNINIIESLNLRRSKMWKTPQPHFTPFFQSMHKIVRRENEKKTKQNTNPNCSYLFYIHNENICTLHVIFKCHIGGYVQCKTNLKLKILKFKKYRFESSILLRLSSYREWESRLRISYNSPNDKCTVWKIWKVRIRYVVDPIWAVNIFSTIK